MEADWKTALVAGVVLGLGLFVQSVIQEFLANRREEKKKRRDDAITTAAETITQKADVVSLKADVVSGKADKVDRLLNGEGLMGALRRILHWQSLHEQGDEKRHVEVSARLLAVEELVKGKQQRENES